MTGITDLVDGQLITRDEGASFETQINRLDQNRDGEAEIFRVGVKVLAVEGAADVIYQAEIPTSYSVLGVVTSQGKVLEGDAFYPIQVALGDLEGAAWINYDLAVKSRAGRFFNTISCQGLVEAGNHPNLFTDDPDTAVFADPTITLLGSEPAIKALKVDTLVGDINGNGQANTGDTLSYATEIQNVGTTDAQNVVYRVPTVMTANLSLVTGSVVTSQGTVVSGNNPGDTEIVINLGTVSLNAGVVVSFQGLVSPSVVVEALYTSCQGIVEGDNFLETKTDDPDTAVLNDPTRTILAEEARLLALKTDTLVGDSNGNGMVDPGDRVRFTTLIQNWGTSNAQGVNFKLEGSRNLTLVNGTVTTTQGLIESGNLPGDTGVTVELGDLSTGQTAEITFETTVDDPLPIGALDGDCQGLVSASNVGSLVTDDPDTAVLNDPTLVSFGLAPRVFAQKTDVLILDQDGDGEADPGDTLEYRITLGNSGNDIAHGVTYGSPGGAHTSLIVGSVTTSAGVVASGNQAGDVDVALTLDDVAPGAEILMSFQVTINSSLPPEITTISCQGLAAGDNISPTPSDDPETSAPGDPTVTPLDRNPALIAEKTDRLVVDLNGNGVVNFGDVVRYTTVITNQGSGDAIGVRFDSGVDVNTDLNVGSVSSSDGQVTSGNQAGETSVTVEIGVIEVGRTITIEFDVTVKNPATSTSASCQGVLIGEGIYVLTDDPDTPEKNDPTETKIEPEYDAFVQAEMTSKIFDQDDSASLTVGDLMEYQISFYPGKNPEGVMFRNRPDGNTRLIDGSLWSSQGGGEIVDGEVQVSLGDLSEQALVYYHVEVVSATDLRVVNQGTVFGSNFHTILTDDPRTPEPGDPTVDYFGGEAVPALSTVGMTVFTTGLIGFGVWRSRVTA